MTKYGIVYTPTDEYVSWYNDNVSKTVLFDSNEKLVKSAIYDIIFSDGGYDGNNEDFQLVTVDIDEDFDGSELIDNDNDVVFVDKKLVNI